MIRKAIIIVSTVLALAVAVLAAVSFITPVWWDSTPTDRGWCALEVDRGCVRVLSFDAANLDALRVAFEAALDNALSPLGKPERRQRTAEDAARLAATFKKTVPELRQRLQQDGLSGELRTGNGVSFHSWRQWRIWGLALYAPRGRFAAGMVIPLWMPLVLFAACPTITCIRGPVRRWRRRRKGCCLKCGYDLAGNVSGVCPECGEPT
jgi:hypothetical protein